MAKFGVFLLFLVCISISYGRRLHRRQAPQPILGQQPQPILAAAAPPPPPPVAPVQPALAQQLVPQQPIQPLVPQQPFGLPPQNIPLSLQQQSIDPNALLQIPLQPQLPPVPQQQPNVVPKQRNFAPGFEAKPIPEDPGLNQPKVQWIGDEWQDSQRALQQQNLPVIRPQDQQQSQIKLQSFPQQFPSPQQQPQPQQPLPADANVPTSDQQELRQRIQQAINTQVVGTAGRDREAFLAKINVTGDQGAAREFIRQIKNLTEFLDKQPFLTVDVMKALVNHEIQLIVDNWIINEEVAGQIAASFNIPRESVTTAFVLTAADVDEMRISGNNPTAAKTFHVQLKELLWQKIDQQYRITTDLLAQVSDALLKLLVGNGIVKEKFSDDIATYFYRSNNRKIRLF